METVGRLTVLYDGGCALCIRCRDFLSTAEKLVPLELLACQSEEAHARYGDVPWLGAELCVADDRGDVWVGPAAFIMCLWALAGWREWSYRISSPAFAPLAERFFAMLSARRQRIAAMLHPRCDGGACSVAPRERPLYR